jgi:hypothetical protein
MLSDVRFQVSAEAGRKIERFRHSGIEGFRH